MLCSECYKKILQGTELQISGTIFCKACAEIDKTKRNTIICNTCYKLVSSNELMHEVYENWSDERSEKLVLCQSCHKWWVREAKSRRKRWKLMKWFDKFSKFNMWLILAFITIDKNRGHVQLGPTLLILAVLSISDLLLSPIISPLIEKIAEWKYKKELKNRNRKIKQKVIRLGGQSKQKDGAQTTK